MQNNDINRKLLEIIDADRINQKVFTKTIQVETEKYREMHRKDQRIKLILVGIIVLLIGLGIFSLCSVDSIEIGYKEKKIEIETTGDDKDKNTTVYIDKDALKEIIKEDGE